MKDDDEGTNSKLSYRTERKDSTLSERKRHHCPYVMQNSGDSGIALVISSFQIGACNELIDSSLGWVKKSKEGTLLIALKLRQYACIMETAVEEIYYGYPHPASPSATEDL